MTSTRCTCVWQPDRDLWVRAVNDPDCPAHCTRCTDRTCCGPNAADCGHRHNRRETK